MRLIRRPWKSFTNPMHSVTIPQATMIEGSQIYDSVSISSAPRLYRVTHRGSQLLQQNVRRQFKGAVREEEHRQCEGVLVADQAEFFLHSKDTSIANVSVITTSASSSWDKPNIPSVQKTEEIQDRNDRNDPKVHLPQHLCFFDIRYVVGIVARWRHITLQHLLCGSEARCILLRHGRSTADSMLGGNDLLQKK